MGLFAYVNAPQPCQHCGKETNDWQTKSVDDVFLQTVTPEQIGAGEFYGHCVHCKMWNAFSVVPAHVRIIPAVVPRDG